MADKCRDIFRSASEKYPEYCGFEGPVLQLVSLAKQSAVGIGHKQIGDRSVWQAMITSTSNVWTKRPTPTTPI